MKVVVLGGGVIGVTTAYYLTKDGHDVTLVERRAGPAEETSFANAGIIAPGHAYAWASPRAPMMLLRSLFRDDTALKLRLRADPALWAWGLRFLANCTTVRNRANTLVKLRLCLYSRAALAALGADRDLAFDHHAKGALYLHRDRAQFDTALANMAALNRNGLALEGIDPARCVALEPALAPIEDRLVGAIFSPDDESGCSHLFSRALVAACEKLGARFRFDTTVTAIRADGTHVDSVVTDRGVIGADAFVLALANDSPRLVRPLGVRLPIYPVKGYSLTVPIAGHAGAPRLPGVDEARLVAFSRLGDRLRLTGVADFAGYDTAFAPVDFTPLLRAARELFPDGGDYERPSYWACLRPMTPDGPPVLGRGRHANLWFNTGHGHMGWTMACGSGRILADLIAGLRPEIPLAGLTPGRF